MSFESFQFVDEEIQNLISTEPTGNSFTALLELPPNQAVKLLHTPEEPTPVFSAMEVEISPETTSSIPPNSSPNYWNAVKQEPIEPGYVHNSSPVFSDPVISKSTKRKEREEKKQVKSSAKKIKSVTKETDGEKLPYIHVRARRGEATDSHSLAERARRDKINARMKLLQELVPGCNKISGTATVLDQIINHVQSLQVQVEFLSMKLAAVRPIIDFNLDSLFSSEDGSQVECNLADMILPSCWVDQQVNENTQQIWLPDRLTSLVTRENSFLSYNSSGNSASSGS